MRRIWEDQKNYTGGGDGPWHFNDAPREMRLRAIDSIPKLFQALEKNALDTAKRVQEKTNKARKIVKAMQAVPEPKKISLKEVAGGPKLPATLNLAGLVGTITRVGKP